jgi:hypothetical protein
MGTPHWNDGSDDSLLWEIITLGGEDLPGIPTVDVSLSRQFDSAKPKGASGATPKDLGEEPAEINVKLHITQQWQIDRLDELVPFLRSKAKGAARPPLEIYYPSVTLWGIRSVVIKSIKLPPPDPVNGMTLELNLLEWVPAPVVTKKSKTKPKAKTTNDAAAWAPFKPTPPGKGDTKKNLGL